MKQVVYTISRLNNSISLNQIEQSVLYFIRYLIDSRFMTSDYSFQLTLYSMNICRSSILVH